MPANARTPAISQPASARLLRRFAAMVYDSLLLMALALAYGALVTWLNVLLQGAPAEGERVDWGLWRLPEIGRASCRERVGRSVVTGRELRRDTKGFLRLFIIKERSLYIRRRTMNSNKDCSVEHK